jgi:4-hydroxybenzoate polyprenyltransferase
LLLVLHPFVFGITLCFGGARQGLLIMGLTYAYNGLGGGEHFIAKNLINAAAYVAFAFGATAVAHGAPVWNAAATKWGGIIGAVVLSTAQMMDMEDQAGDGARGRRTLPLVIGDRAARWSIAVPVMAWAILTPWFWRIGSRGYIAPGVLGWMVAHRVLTKRTVRGDRTTFRLWNLWIMSIYALPVLKRMGI